LAGGKSVLFVHFQLHSRRARGVCKPPYPRASQRGRTLLLRAERARITYEYSEMFMRLYPYALAFAAGALSLAPPPAFANAPAVHASYAQRPTGGYVATNAAAGNAIVAYRAARSGALSILGTYPTGGNGVGPYKVPLLAPSPVDPLGSNASVHSVTNGHTLLVVNAGSNSITSFTINADDSLSGASVVPSGGLFPTSIASFGSLVYVANVGNPTQGTSATVSGFTLAANGQLTPIPNSTRTLSVPATSQAATIVFSPNGRVLAVADVAANLITTFAVASNGTLGAPIATPSHGVGPFGAVFHDDTLLVQETQGGAPGGASLTSYHVLPNGQVTPISASVPSGETAGCWLTTRVASPLVFVADTGSGTISTYLQFPNGTLTLVQSAASPVVSGGAPIDLGLSDNNGFVYQLYDALGTVAVYRSVAGYLAYVGSAAGLPTSGAQGLAVY
jgi:6-phosphogluconolactonase (cycloisomerase 2 family)